MLAEIPIGRLSKSEEIAFAVAFLCSHMADYITGINLPIDGGVLKSL
jgi:3-oxoacyl-[acyl-carrier protein] reductase